MTALIEFNARPIPPSEVARSFVPPHEHFSALLTRNHTLILGPRGSGKTTLLKMLTVRGLRGWLHEDAQMYSKKIKFNGVFIPADIAWGRQIDVLRSLDSGVARKEAAFVIHTLRALVRAMRDAVELSRGSVPEHLEHLAVEMTAKAEFEVVRLIADRLSVAPRIDSFLGVENALEALLDRINVGESEHNFSVNSLQSKVTLMVSAFNGLSGNDDRRWALLFDEMEIAPTRIKSFLLSGVRSFDERIVVKLALVPYMDDAGLEDTPASPQPLHDYETVQLTYPNKDDAKEFTVELFKSAFERMLDFSVENVADVFSRRAGQEGFGKKRKGKTRRRELPNEFISLATKDDSFSAYIRQRKLLSPDYNFNETNIAKDIRKVMPIVIARDYYIRQQREHKNSLNRSRKSYELYTGYPSVLDVTEGNPRAILTLITPFVKELSESSRRGGQLAAISTALQSQAIRRVELLLTTLLQVIPLDMDGFEPGKGLLDFVDKIGRSFERRLLEWPFAPDYVGTFVLDRRVPHAFAIAVGKAVNAGALIHVPSEESGADSILRGLYGQRFRISYALAPRFRLLLTLGDKISLTRLFEQRESTIPDLQVGLFDEDASQ